MLSYSVTLCSQNRQNVATTTGYGLNNGNGGSGNGNGNGNNGFSLLNLDSPLAVNKKSQVKSYPNPLLVDS